MDKISVIVPVYAAEEYLDQCVKSILGQTHDHLEAILVDDGSPDGSGAICDRYARKDDRVRVIHKENGGVSSARNAGLDEASGDYVFFCDSDDWMQKRALETLLAAQQKNNSDIAFGDIIHAGKKRRRAQLFAQEFDVPGTDICKLLQKACIGYGYNPFPTGKWVISGLGSVGNKLYRASIIRENDLKFDDYTNGVYEDNLFAIGYLERASGASYVPRGVYNYRMVEDSSIHRYRPESPETSARIFERVQEFIRQQDTEYHFEEAFHILVMRRLSEELRVYYFNKSNPKSLGEKMAELDEAIRTEPYRTAIREVDRKRLMPAHLLTCRTAASGSARVMWAGYVARSAAKKFI